MKTMTLILVLLLLAPFQALALDDYTLEIYQRSCKTCHENPDTTAPQTGNSEDWKPRLEKGMDTLLTSTIEGSGAMPPLGMCMDCEAEDFEALIKYMSGTE